MQDKQQPWNAAAMFNRRLLDAQSQGGWCEIEAGEIEAAIADFQSLLVENERLNDWLLETQMLAHKWMEAHDKLHSGKSYEFPKPADLPNALKENERLREGLSGMVMAHCGGSNSSKKKHAAFLKARALLGDS